jgi:hypothetical protein
MPGPKPPQIVLSEYQRLALEHIVRAHSSGQALVRRARVVLLAAMGYSNMDIAREVPHGRGSGRAVATPLACLARCAIARVELGRSVDGCAATRCSAEIDGRAGVPNCGAGMRAAD